MLMIARTAALGGIMAGLLLIAGAQAQTAKPAMDKMPGMSGSPGAAGTKQASATGTVMTVNATQHKVKLDHGPIPAIGWPAMKMEFAAAPSVDLAKLKPGDKVQFSLSGTDSSYTVQSIAPVK